jgi:hypothetical protein
MRDEHVEYLFWLLVIGSWVFGVTYGKWLGGTGGVFADLSQAVSVPEPVNLAWWGPLLYFPLTVVGSFVLSQLFFGAGTAVFMFSRGVGDSILFISLENALRTWNIPDVTSGQLWNAFFIMLVLAVNLPLCLWAAHLGTRRSVRMYQRLRGKPVKPESSVISTFLMLLSVSLLIGLVGTLTISYTL